MKQLLKFELRKLLRSKSFYICLGICLFMLIVNGITNKLLENMIKEAVEQIGQPYALSSGAITSMKATFNNNTAIIEGVIITIIVCEDFVGDTIKNIYSKGYTRRQVYFAKLISSLIAFFAIFIAGMITSFLLGLALFRQIGEVGNLFIPSMIGIILISLAYFAVDFSIAIMTKKIAPSIIVAVIGPTIMLLLCALIDAIIGSKTFSISDYWLSGLLTNLSLTVVESKDVIAAVIESLIFIVTFGLLSFFVNNKKDAK